MASHLVPELTDSVVTLRAHLDRDVPRIVEQCQDEQMVAWTSVPQPYRRETARAFLRAVRADWAAEGRDRSWAITDAGDDYLGTIDLRPASDGRASIGFGLHPAARGRGLMVAAVRLVCGWAFEHGVEVVRWEALVGNWASRRVAWACGFTMAGTVPGLLGAGGRGRHDGWVGTLRAGDPMTPRTRWFTPPELTDGVVRLRSWRAEDRTGLVDPDEVARRYMPAGAAPQVAEFDRWLTARQERMSVGAQIHWCVADATDDRPLGHLQLFRLEEAFTAGSAEVGYWLLPAARGRAVMTRALALLRDHALAPVADGGLGLHRLSAGTDAENEASNALLRRTGFTLVGLERSVLARAGAPSVDGLLWELLADRPAAQAPVIEGRSVRLRPWRQGDVERIVQACTDPRTRQWLPGLPEPYRRQDASSYIAQAADSTAQRRSVHWAVARPDDDEAIGSVTLSELDPTGGSAQVGYWTHPQARRQGVMRQAVWLAARHAFVPTADGGLGLRRLTLTADEANLASRHVAESVGFVHTGRARAALPRPGGAVGDAACYDLLADELPGQPPG